MQQALRDDRLAGEQASAALEHILVTVRRCDKLLMGRQHAGGQRVLGLRVVNHRQGFRVSNHPAFMDIGCPDRVIGCNRGSRNV